MGVTTYYSAGGELLGHRTDVGAAYGTDALGSVTVTAIDDQQRTPTNYYYKPYGSRLNKLGNNPDPKFQWVGTAGYRETAISHSKSYVRARHLGQEEGRWSTVDPLWPREPSYGYVRQSPIRLKDPTGLIPTVDPACGPIMGKQIDGVNGCISKLCSASTEQLRMIWKCMRDFLVYDDSAPKCLSDWCKIGKTITCSDAQCNNSRFVRTCPRKCGGTLTFKGPECAYNDCQVTGNPSQSSQINFCPFWFTSFPPDCANSASDYCGMPTTTILHEWVHLCGKCKGGSNHDSQYNAAAKCIAQVLRC